MPAGSTTVLSEPLIFSKEGPNLDFESKSSLFYILLQVFKKHCAVQQKHMCGQYLTWGTSVRVWLPGRWDYGNFYYAELLTQTIQPTQNPMQASHNYQSDQQFCSWLYTQKSWNSCPNTCTQIFTAALFIQLPKDRNIPNVHSWVMDKQIWRIPIMEYYSATKRNEALIHVTTWMNLENVMPDAKGHRVKVNLYKIPGNVQEIYN